MRVVAISTCGVAIPVQQRTLVHRVRITAGWERMSFLRELLVDVGNCGRDGRSAIVAVQTVLSGCVHIGQSLFCRRQKSQSRPGLMRAMAGLAAVLANRAVGTDIGRSRGLLTSPGVGAVRPRAQPVIAFRTRTELASSPGDTPLTAIVLPAVAGVETWQAKQSAELLLSITRNAFEESRTWTCGL